MPVAISSDSIKKSQTPQVCDINEHTLRADTLTQYSHCGIKDSRASHEDFHPEEADVVLLCLSSLVSADYFESSTECMLNTHLYFFSCPKLLSERLKAQSCPAVFISLRTVYVEILRRHRLNYLCCLIDIGDKS